MNKLVIFLMTSTIAFLVSIWFAFYFADLNQFQKSENAVIFCFYIFEINFLVSFAFIIYKKFYRYKRGLLVGTQVICLLFLIIIGEKSDFLPTALMIIVTAAIVDYLEYNRGESRDKFKEFLRAFSLFLAFVVARIKYF